jgi:GxxExxY protein
MNTNEHGSRTWLAGDHERGQMLNYLRITKLRVGLILNFKHARLEWERVVL